LAIKRNNPVKDGIRFVKEARKELRKVSWPSRKESTAVTVVVIISVFIAGFYLAIVDWVLSMLVQHFIG